jgi:tetratricopeptide (TPR) repeat protein
MLCLDHVHAIEAKDPAEDGAKMRQLSFARELIDAHKPREAITQQIDPVIGYYEAKYNKKTTKVYCTRTPVETLAYMVLAASNKQDAIAIGSEWSSAYFMKAYALLELKESQIAKNYLKKALELSPYNSQFISELAHILQLEKKWQESYDLFVSAAEHASAFTPEESKTREMTRALRGQGYCLAEMNRLDEAEKIYNKCMELDPLDRTSKSELAYIDSLKRKGAR